MADSEFKRLLTVWHGSPYDWDRVDMSKIGTGEGTKAMGGFGIRGHGFYAGEAKGTGESYMRNVSKKRRNDTSGASYEIKGVDPRTFGRLLKELEDRERMLGTVQAWREINQGDQQGLKGYEDTLKNHDLVVDNLIERHGLNEFKDLLKSLDHHDLNHLDDVHHSLTWDGFKGSDAIDALDESIIYHARQAAERPEAYAKYGDRFERQRRLEPLVRQMKKVKSNINPRLYELQVHLEPHEVLDWDQQLEEHHPEAAAKIRQAAGDDAFQADFDDEGEIREEAPLNEDYSEGGDVYKHLADKHGGAPAASEALRQAGIKGIRFEDQGSRNNSHIRVLHLSGEPIKDDVQGETSNPAINAHRYVVDMAAASRPVASPDELAMRLSERASHEKDPHYKTIWSRAATWVEDNLRDLDLRPPPKTYNYVLFDPDRIQVVRKYDDKGQKVFEKE